MYPALKEGLKQIPVKYLRGNLLPLLQDEKSPLTFRGNIVNIDGFM